MSSSPLTDEEIHQYAIIADSITNEKLCSELEAFGEMEREMADIAESDESRDIHFFAMTVMMVAARRLRSLSDPEEIAEDGELPGIYSGP